MRLMLFILIAITVACSGSNNEDSGFVYTNAEIEKILPTELNLSVEVLGLDINNPYGDGTGVVQFSALAKNAVKYGFIINDESEVESKDGTFSYTMKEEGTHDSKITVWAYSKTGDAIYFSEMFTVFVAEHEAKLIWSDEFEVDGAISSENWKSEIIAPDNGSWWNGELQHYTNRMDNAYVSEGTLKIVAKKEQYTAQGTTKDYTSARLNSLFSFTYGRVEVRAKLPYGKGTWPAIWMLGSNIETVGWPACGEIDIMEHWGHEPEKISSATHTPSCSGGCSQVTVGSTNIADYDTEFHVYGVEWTEDALRFLIDDEFVYSYNPTLKNIDSWPFTADQFIILNVAMGGSWFIVDPNFTSSTMEVDYVRVYQ
ncbi:glycoside hydrolase family 16 protein [Arenibacter sp. N53]|uniref:glycoside hydrolase family 16 protein n=1 Tax=Arenibacter TaxID=178469 RepID=UPI000CD3B4E6|nr:MULTISPECIES: glycoside hydrolase family 16 protein [Arenibacter]MCM4151731.1 glycoside hydrolase family 16 protein [Arenibacter sp. N53]